MRTSCHGARRFGCSGKMTASSKRLPQSVRPRHGLELGHQGAADRLPVSENHRRFQLAHRIVSVSWIRASMLAPVYAPRATNVRASRGDVEWPCEFVAWRGPGLWVLANLAIFLAVVLPGVLEHPYPPAIRPVVEWGGLVLYVASSVCQLFVATRPQGH